MWHRVERAIGELNPQRYVDLVCRGGSGRACGVDAPRLSTASSSSGTFYCISDGVSLQKACLHSAAGAEQYGWIADAAIDHDSASISVVSVEISVRDYGCGVSEADAARLFEEFQQVRR